MVDRRRDSATLWMILLFALIEGEEDYYDPRFRRLLHLMRRRLQESEEWSPQLDELFLHAEEGWRYPDDTRWERFYDLMRRRLRETQDWSPELDELFFEILHRPRHRSRLAAQEARRVTESLLTGFQQGLQEETHGRLRVIEEQVASLRETVDKAHAVHGEGLDTLRVDVNSLVKNQESTAGVVREQAARCENIAAELHTFFWAASTGADFSRIRTIQYIPVRIYVGDPVPGQDALAGMIQAIERLGGAIALERAEEFPEETGSWWKKLVLRTKNVATHEEVKKNLEKAKVALELAVIDQRQARVTKALAEATALVIREVRDIPGPCCIQSGSLLVVKSSGVDGSTSIASRTLSPMQLKKLEENQDMLQRPADIMPWLASAERGDTHGTEERAVEWVESNAFQGVQHRIELPGAPRELSIPAKGELVWLAEAIIQDFKARNSPEGELVGKFGVEATPKLVAFVNWLLGELRGPWRKRGAKGNKQVPLSQKFLHEIGEMIIKFGRSIGEGELATPEIAEKLVASIGRLLEKHPNALIGQHRPRVR